MTTQISGVPRASHVPQQTGITIRAMRAEDVNSCDDLYRKAAGTPFSRANYIRSLISDPGAHPLVALDANDKVVGFQTATNNDGIGAFGNENVLKLIWATLSVSGSHGKKPFFYLPVTLYPKVPLTL